MQQVEVDRANARQLDFYHIKIPALIHEGAQDPLNQFLAIETNYFLRITHYFPRSYTHSATHKHTAVAEPSPSRFDGRNFGPSCVANKAG